MAGLFAELLSLRATVDLQAGMVRAQQQAPDQALRSHIAQAAGGAGSVIVGLGIRLSRLSAKGPLGSGR